MSVMETLGQLREAMTVRRVYGEPYERNGVTVIPAAAIRGGGGGGEGEQPDGQGRGAGGGFGLFERPVGAFVIRGQEVTWQPAVDATRIALTAQAVAVVALFTLRTILRSRSRTKRKLARRRGR